MYICCCSHIYIYIPRIYICRFDPAVFRDCVARRLKTYSVHSIALLAKLGIVYYYSEPTPGLRNLCVSTTQHLLRRFPVIYRSLIYFI